VTGNGPWNTLDYTPDNRKPATNYLLPVT